MNNYRLFGRAVEAARPDREQTMFIDYAKIRIRAGNGGNGAVAFHREKFVASGGPDGGDGGRGGDVVFMADDHLSTLADFKYKRSYQAPNGANGSGNRKTGKSGEDLIIKVPRGTVIKEAESGAVLADISEDGPYVLAKGGKGGWGNQHFSSATRQAPRFSKDGFPGEEWDVILELKLLADVGLLGYPNVGKSTLISVVSEAKPVIADYHFTTLTPVLGVVRMGPESSFVMADIPGLIEGAGEGVGLGHRFLRHVERCRMLVHVVDVSGSEGRDPIGDFLVINSELEKFDPVLARSPQIVAANKIDMATDEQLARFRSFIEEQGLEYYEICAPIAMGTQELINAVAKKLASLPPIKRYEAEPVPEAVLSAKKVSTGFTVTVEDGVFYVEAPWLMRIINKTDMDDYESMQYFQRVLESSGILASLIEKGVKEGDTVSIYGLEFDYVP